MIQIVVPVHIPEFVPIIQHWHKGYSLNFMDGEPPSGRNVRQSYTNYFTGSKDLIHFLDCDNLVPHEVLGYLNNYKDKIYMFDQRWWTNGPKRLIAKPENCVRCRCDTAQIFVSGKFLKDMIWEGHYEDDGVFIAELYRRYPDDFIFVNDLEVYYNALKPNNGLYEGQIKLIA